MSPILLPAAHKRISLVASWASAGGSVSCWHTVSIGTTGVGVAGVRLLLAASDGVWGWDVSWDTLAHWVAQAIDIALGVGSTGAGVAGVRGRGSHLNLGAAYGI